MTKPKQPIEMEKKDLTYKIKCRSCSKITEMWFGTTEQTTKANFLKWASEHSTFPFQKQCNCDNGSMLFHDLISYTLIAAI
jgi:hypothetical protein